MTDSNFDFFQKERKEGESGSQINKTLTAQQNATLRESAGWAEVEKLRQQLTTETYAPNINLTAEIPIPKVGQVVNTKTINLNQPGFLRTELIDSKINPELIKARKSSKGKVLDSLTWFNKTLERVRGQMIRKGSSLNFLASTTSKQLEQAA